MTSAVAPSKFRPGMPAVRRPLPWKWILAFGLPLTVIILAVWSLESDRPKSSESAASSLSRATSVDQGASSPLEAALFKTDWRFDDPRSGRRFTYYHLRFEKNHMVRTLGMREVWHWWITGTYSIHLQLADDPAAYDPQRGTNLTFDASFRHFDALSADGARFETGEPTDSPGDAKKPAKLWPSPARLRIIKTPGP